MYEVLCERCLHTEPADAGAAPSGPCPACGDATEWLGPFAQLPEQGSKRDSWPVLTSPLYAHAGRPDRRSRPR